METLKDLLKISPKGADLNAHFEIIARKLMGNYVIKKGEDEYAIVEIEFYYYSKYHPDYITYPRDMGAGRWFFHQSGVDLTFESYNVKKDDKKAEKYIIKDDSSFGGILLRGIRKLNCNDLDKEYIFGPIKCVNTLWDKFDAFSLSANEYPILIEQTVEGILYQCKRHINIKDEKKTDSVKNWLKRLSIDTNDKDLDSIFENAQNRPYRFFYLNQNPTQFIKTPFDILPNNENQ